MIEPENKRLFAFFDGQNLFHSAKESFGCHYPDYDPVMLTHAIASMRGWSVTEIHFYTGIPSLEFAADWTKFWNSKLQVLGSRGVITFSRPLRYNKELIQNHDGTLGYDNVGREKGIDVRIAIDIVRGAMRGVYDVALIFSQDQDLSEAAEEVKAISKTQKRWIKVACAFPDHPGNGNNRGINGTDWIKIPENLYKSCIDLRDYRKQ